MRTYLFAAIALLLLCRFGAISRRAAAVADKLGLVDMGIEPCDQKDSWRELKTGGYQSRFDFAGGADSHLTRAIRAAVLPSGVAARAGEPLAHSGTGPPHSITTRCSVCCCTRSTGFPSTRPSTSRTAVGTLTKGDTIVLNMPEGFALTKEVDVVPSAGLDIKVFGNKVGSNAIVIVVGKASGTASDLIRVRTNQDIAVRANAPVVSEARLRKIGQYQDTVLRVLALPMPE